MPETLTQVPLTLMNMPLGEEVVVAYIHLSLIHMFLSQSLTRFVFYVAVLIFIKLNSPSETHL